MNVCMNIGFYCPRITDRNDCLELHCYHLTQLVALLFVPLLLQNKVLIVHLIFRNCIQKEATPNDT